MKNRGISLIVLIITIVVIIILAAAIILNLSNTNLIENANEAVVKQDIKSFQDELTMYIADQYADTLGKFKAEELDVTDKEEICEIIPSINGTKYEGKIEIKNGKLVVSEKMSEPEKTWVLETLGEDKTALATVGIKVENTNATITGERFTYNNPVIPVGFKALSTDDASWADSNNDGIVDGWNDGLVIQDDDLNEFVWVPCTLDGVNGSIQYTKRFDEYPKYSTITSVSDDMEALPMKDENTRVTETEQITKYGGFYIGRYEAGVPENQTTIDGTSSSTSDVVGIPVVQRGATVWTSISYNNAMPNAKKLYENSISVRSGLLTGTAWDTVCAWIESETDSEGNVIHSVTNSISWGNYKDTTGNAQYDKDGTTKISGTKKTTGYSEYWKAKNIYDLAGNTWNFTGEIQSYNRIIRGGLYSHDGSTYPASYRHYGYPSSTKDNISFRVVLYVM